MSPSDVLNKTLVRFSILRVVSWLSVDCVSAATLSVRSAGVSAVFVEQQLAMIRQKMTVKRNETFFIVCFFQGLIFLKRACTEVGGELGSVLAVQCLAPFRGVLVAAGLKEADGTFQTFQALGGFLQLVVELVLRRLDAAHRVVAVGFLAAVATSTVSSRPFT